MKNLFQQPVNEQKFRGILKETISNTSDEEEGGTTFDALSKGSENTINALLGTFGTSLGDFEKFRILAFGDFDELCTLFGFLEGEVEDEDKEENEEGGEDDETSNTVANNPEEGPLLEGTLDGRTAYNMLNPDIGVTSSKYPVVKPPFLPRNTKGTTSLHGIRPLTINGINHLQKQLNIPLMITGGTETFCHSKTGGHHQGKKLDISFKNGVETKMDEYMAEKNNIKITDIVANKKYTFKDGDYTITVIKEIGVEGGDHYDIAFA